MTICLNWASVKTSEAYKLTFCSFSEFSYLKNNVLMYLAIILFKSSNEIKPSESKSNLFKIVFVNVSDSLLFKVDLKKLNKVSTVI